MLIPADLTETEAKNLADEMKNIRFRKLRETTEQDRILADIMRLRFDIEQYVNNDIFAFDKTFGNYLAEYMRVLKKNRREISEDLSLHYTKLSRIINDKEEPNIELTYRLGKHSGNLIKAELWWKLIIKKQAFILKRDNETRLKEEAKVKNYLIAS
jgi:plasmid maintenance system antidote protein VapI